MFNSRSKSLMCFVRSVISYPLCASPCPLLLWGVFSGRICLLLCFSQCDGICSFMVPLPQTKCKSVILLRTGRTDAGRINRVLKPNQRASTWRDAILRVLTVWEGKWFRLPLSPHPLFSPTPPQVLTPFNNVQLLTDTKTALHCTSSIFCFAHPMGFILDSWKHRWL